MYQPTINITCVVEAATLSHVAEETKQDPSRVLRKAKPLKPNITKQERMPLSRLKRKEELIILPADKRNVTVVMANASYNSEISCLLDEATFIFAAQQLEFY